MNLNQFRVLFLSLLVISLVGIIIAGSVVTVLIAVMIILSSIWIATETGTHASYTIQIGQMLNYMMMKMGIAPTKTPPKEILSDQGLQITNDKALGKLHQVLPDGEEYTGANDVPTEEKQS